jgi:hypothetical protein
MRKVWIAFVLALALTARAQSPDLSSPQTTEDALHAMSQQAAIIFTGHILAVHQPKAASGALEIEFAVDDAIRGVRTGTYILREWAGLSPAGESPFRAGQHYLMLLHAPGPSGLSSPVGGPDGAIPIRGANPSTGPETEFLSRPPRNLNGQMQSEAQTVDLRWIATRVIQPILYRSEPVAHPTGFPVAAQPDARIADTPRGDLTYTASCSAITTLLRAWEQSDAAR